MPSCGMTYSRINTLGASISGIPHLDQLPFLCRATLPVALRRSHSSSLCARLLASPQFEICGIWIRSSSRWYTLFALLPAKSSAEKPRDLSPRFSIPPYNHPSIARLTETRPQRQSMASCLPGRCTWGLACSGQVRAQRFAICAGGRGFLLRRGWSFRVSTDGLSPSVRVRTCVAETKRRGEHQPGGGRRICSDSTLWHGTATAGGCCCQGIASGRGTRLGSACSRPRCCVELFVRTCSFRTEPKPSWASRQPAWTGRARCRLYLHTSRASGDPPALLQALELALAGVVGLALHEVIVVVLAARAYEEGG